MDMRSWKRTLLQWITECNFTQHNYLNIEQTDIDVFYRNFVKNHKANITETHILDFINENYPHFDVHLDCENNCISPEDYVYVYSLLLHYSCVKNPEPFYHAICQKLSEKTQQHIEIFLKAMMDCADIDKSDMRHVIAEVVKNNNNTNNSSPLSNDSFSSNSTSSSDAVTDSPLNRSPYRFSSFAVDQRIRLPSTPKTSLLEQRTREIQSLRAQIETEHYEKSLLEAQIKQNEQRIQNLNEDRQKMLKEIQKLKSELYNMASETEPTESNTHDQSTTIRRLRREIGDKEERIFNLSTELDKVRDEKDLKQEEMNLMRKNIKDLCDRLKESDNKINELETDLQRKEHEIATLFNDKQELNQYIAEIRASSSSAKPDFNMSSDCFDSSLPRYTNSSGSLTSPENLGVSVVDVQLREVKLQNQELSEQLKLIKSNNERLSTRLAQIMSQQQKTYNNIMNNDDQHSIISNAIATCPGGMEEEKAMELEHNLQMYENFVENLGKMFIEKQNHCKKLDTDLQRSSSVNTQLMNRIEQCDKDIAEFKNNLEHAETKNNELLLCKQKLEDDIVSLEMTSKKLKHDADSEIKTLESKIEICTKENVQKIGFIEELNSKFVSLQAANNELEGKLENLEKDYSETVNQYSAEIDALRDVVSANQKHIESQLLGEQILREQYDKLQEKYEDTSRELRESTDHVRTMHVELNNKKLEFHKLGNEIADLKAHINESEEKLLFASNKFDDLQGKNAFLENQLSEKKDVLQSLMNENEKFQMDLKNNRIKVNSLNSLLQIASDVEGDLKSNLDQIANTVNTMLQSHDSATKRIEALEEENKVYGNMVKALEQSAANLENEKHALEEKLSVNEVQLLENEKKIENYEKQIEDLKSALENNQLNSSNMQKENATLREELLANKQELSKSQQTQKEVQKAKMELEAQLKTRTNEFLASEQKANEKLKIQEEKINRLSEDIGRKCNDLEQKETAFISMLEKTRQLEIELKGEKEERAFHESALDAGRNVLVELQTKLREDEEQRQQLLKEKAVLAAKLAANENEMTILEKKVVSTRDEQKDKIKSCEDEIAKLAKQNEKHCKDIKSFKNEQSKTEVRIIEADKVLKQLSAQLDSELECKQVLTARIEGLEQQLQKNEIDFEELSKQHQAVKIELNSAETKLGIAVTDINSLDNMKEEYSRKIEELNEKLEILNNEHRDLLGEVEAMEKSNGRLTEVKEEYASSLRSTQREKATLIELLDQKAEELKQYSNESETLKKENLVLSQKIEQNERALMELLMLLSERHFIAENGGGSTGSSCSSGNGCSSEDQDNIMSSTEKNSNINYKRLRNCLNQLLQNLSVLEVERKQLNTEKLRLSTELSNVKKHFAEAQAMQCESDAKQNHMRTELRTIREQSFNVEKVNERLINEMDDLANMISQKENEIHTLQMNIERLEDVNKGLNREKEAAEKFHKQIMDLHETEGKRLNDLLASKDSELDAVRCNFNETMEKLNVKTNYLCDKLDADLRESREECEKYKVAVRCEEAKTKQIQESLECVTNEYKALQHVYDDMRQQVVKGKKDVRLLEDKITELNNIQQETLKDLNVMSAKLEETNAELLVYQNRSAELEAKMQDAGVDSEHLRMQVKNALCDVQRLSNERKTLLDEKEQMLRKLKALQETCRETAEANSLLEQQYAEYKSNEDASETKMKSTLERSQSLERELLTAENAKKALQNALEKMETQIAALNEENAKLRESQNISTKRIEKLALKLGDVQARNTQLERECDRLQSTNATQIADLENLSREKEKILNAHKMLKERFAQLEGVQGQLTLKIQNLERTNEDLNDTKENLEAFEKDAKIKLSKYEKMRDIFEEKIQYLNGSLSTAEQNNVRLTLDIGALNSQIVELKQGASSKHKAELDGLTNQLLVARKHSDRCGVLENEVDDLHQENINLKDKLSKLTLSLQLKEDKCKELLRDVESLKNDLTTMVAVKDELQTEHESIKQKLRDYEILNNNLLIEKREVIAELEVKIEYMNRQTTCKDELINELNDKIEVLKADIGGTANAQKKKCDELSAEIESLSNRLRVTEGKLQKEFETSLQLRQDNQVLHAKYMSTKERLEDLERDCENRIKENRIEMEGKLEKMKTKMKTLYVDETDRLKRKHEREVVHYKTEIDKLRSQTAEFERINRKLMKDAESLRACNLDYDKQCTFLLGKLKQFERSVSVASNLTMTASTLQNSTKTSLQKHGMVSSTTSLPTAVATNISPNFTMEDEEGEIFNNTYLVDLKNGRVSRDICAEELQYRNSLVPPHLRSSYPAQYFHNLCEDEVKDGPHSLDDSTSLLLSGTTVSCHQRKTGGITRYKKPGPPTPSKNGGRLSFGGNTEPAREILKEIPDDNNISSTKTPSRFHMFSSRFSMGNSTKNEIQKAKEQKPVAAPHREMADSQQSPIVKTQKDYEKFNNVIHGSARKFHPKLKLIRRLCTSTPRKYKTDQMQDKRRLRIEKTVTSSHSSSNCLQPTNGLNDIRNSRLESELSIIETPPTSRPMFTPKPKPLLMHRNKPRTTMARRSSSIQKQYKPNYSLRRQHLKKRIQVDPLMQEMQCIESDSITQNRKQSSEGRCKRVPRVSLVLPNPSFAPIQMQMRPSHEKQRNNIRKQMKCKQRLKRFETHNRGRMLGTPDFVSPTDEKTKTIATNATYNLKPNKNDTNDGKLNRNRKSLMLSSEQGSLQDDQTGESKQSLLNTYDNGCNSEWGDILDCEEKSDDYDQQSSNVCKGFGETRKITFNTELTEFDRELDQFQLDVSSSKGNLMKIGQLNSNHRFEQLLQETASEAPFKVNRLQYFDAQPIASETQNNSDAITSTLATTSSSTLMKTINSSSQNSSSTGSSINNVVSSTAIMPNKPQMHIDSPIPSITSTTNSASTTPKPYSTVNNSSRKSLSSLISSRVIYGAQIVYNPRLPNVASTEVRKSSIYLKRRLSDAPTVPSSSCSNYETQNSRDNIILVTNQTITIIDIFHMWCHMNAVTRFILCLAALGFLLLLFQLFNIIL